MPTSRKRSAAGPTPDAQHMSGAKKRQVTSATVARSQSDDEILLKAAEILQTSGHPSSSVVLDAIRSAASTNQDLGGARKRHPDDAVTTARRRVQESDAPNPSAPSTSQVRGPPNPPLSSELPTSRNVVDPQLLDIGEQSADLISSSDWATVLAEWTDCAEATTNVDSGGTSILPHQPNSNGQRMYHNVAIDSFVNDFQEPGMFPPNLENEDSNLSTFHQTVMNIISSKNQQTHELVQTSNPFPSLGDSLLFDESMHGADSLIPVPYGTNQNVVAITNRSLTPLDTDSWEDLASSSNQVISRSTSSGSLGWEHVSQEPRQSSSTRSHSPTLPVLEQLVDLDVPNASRSSGQRLHGRFESEAKRQETRRTRKMGACLRCKRQRLRFSKESKQTIHTLPCLRYKLIESTLFRTGQLHVQPDLKWSNRWAAIKMTEITNWASSDLKKIKVSQDLCPKPFEVVVRQFVPIKGDSLQRKWTDGKTRKSKDVPPYAIENMSKTGVRLKRFIEENASSAIEHLLSHKEPLLKETYAMAKQYATSAPRDEERSLIQDVLQLWFAVRQTTRSEFIVGEETLGMVPELKDQSYPLFGKVPIPPVMGLQFNIMLTLNVLIPLKKSVLDQLQHTLSSNRPKSWITIYLCTFVLLHNCALITAWCYDYARKHGLKERYSYPRVVEDLHHGANMLLAHFHYYNKECHLPSLNLEERHDTVLSDLSVPEYRFMIRTIELVRLKDEDFTSLKEYKLYEDDMYFVSQMFEKDWGPRNSYVSPV